MAAQKFSPKVESLLVSAARYIIASKAGSTKTRKKAKSSAKNGRLGGRPRKLAAA
jgi:hypothetical protein